MSQLTPEIASDVVAACQANAADVGDALSRGLDGTFAAKAGEAADFDAGDSGLVGPGLAMFFSLGDEAAIALLPDSSGLVPEWTQQPDVTGESKLGALAQELSMLLLPESLMAAEFKAAWVADLAEAVTRCGMVDSAKLVPVELEGDGKTGRLSLAWPCTKAAQLIPETKPASETDTESDTFTNAGQPAASPAAESASSGPAAGNVLSQLPPYSRSLLQIEVTMTVRLAEKKQDIHDIVGLVPGSIISFEKSCDDPLEITIGDEIIAHGEAVKVGEKFGVRLHEMVLPEERFKTVRKKTG